MNPDWLNGIPTREDGVTCDIRDVCRVYAENHRPTEADQRDAARWRQYVKNVYPTKWDSGKGLAEFTARVDADLDAAVRQSAPEGKANG